MLTPHTRFARGVRQDVSLGYTAGSGRTAARTAEAAHSGGVVDPGASLGVRGGEGYLCGIAARMLMLWADGKQVACWHQTVEKYAVVFCLVEVEHLVQIHGERSLDRWLGAAEDRWSFPLHGGSGQMGDGGGSCCSRPSSCAFGVGESWVVQHLAGQFPEVDFGLRSCDGGRSLCFVGWDMLKGGGEMDGAHDLKVAILEV